MIGRYLSHTYFNFIEFHVFCIHTLHTYVVSFIDKPPVDLYLNSEKSVWKNQVQRIGFLVYFELDFYCLCKSLVPSMWFWSVSWSTNCPVYFWFFLVDQRKICPVSDLFCSLSWIFCPVFFENVVLVSLLADQLSGQFPIFWKRLDKKFKSEQKRSDTGQIFFWSTKKNKK